MDGLSNNPLLQPTFITKVLDSIQPDSEQFALTQDCPMVTIPGRRVTVDVRQTIGGMTMAVAEGSESPVVEKRGAQQWSFDPAHWREKVLLSEKDVGHLRQLGTVNELETAQSHMTSIISQLRMRLENRMEWAKWQMMQGTLTISQPDVQFTVDYGIPAEFKPVLTGADLWDSGLAGADPMEDILNWIQLYRSEGSDPAFFMYNANVERALLLNDKIRTLMDSVFTGQNNPAMLSRDNLRRVFNAYTGLEPRVYDKGYWLVAGTQAAITPASTSVVVDDASDFAIGDVMILVHRTSDHSGRVRVPITGVSGTTVSFLAIGGTVTYPAGSEVKIKKQFIPDDTFIIRGALPPGTSGGQNFGEFVAVNHVYGPGGLMAPQAGMFSRVLDKSDDDPPRIELIAGVSGLPVLYHVTNNLIATVTS